MPRENLTAVFLAEARHDESKHWHVVSVNGEDSWRPKERGERMKTVYVGLVLCLNIGVDPPDVQKPQPCARLECWLNPMQLAQSRAMETITQKLQKQYERWQPRARYKHAPDPTVEDVKKLCQSLRRNAKEDRVLFHYNGHGVPKPTNNGEIWVFNKNFTQYIPLSLYDLQVWLGAPAVYIWDCNYAGLIVKHFIKFAQDHDRENNSKNTKDPKSGDANLSSNKTCYHNCIQLAACGEEEMLPLSPLVPADLFTSCLTTPISTAVMCYVQQQNLAHRFPPEVWKNIPGDPAERRSLLGELNWIFTAVTDTVAWNCLPRAMFQRLFRQDLLVASLFRNFLLADRIMRVYSCTPKSNPQLPTTFEHPLWEAWDLALDRCLVALQNRTPINNATYLLNPCGVDPNLSQSELVLPAGLVGGVAPAVTPALLPIQLQRSNSISGSTVLNQPIAPILIPPLIPNVPNPMMHIALPPPPTPVLTSEYSHSGFFADQLDAFEVWLSYGHLEGESPQQLPVVLQVLLSQVLRLRALELLGRFLDKGAWAVKASLSVGIFPYVLKLLLCKVSELRSPLAFIWAKILAVDPNCLTDLIAQGGHEYFIKMLDANDITCKKKVLPAFVLAVVASDTNLDNDERPKNLTGQQALLQCGYASICMSMLLGECSCARVRLWILLGLGKLWAKFDQARWQAIRAGAQTMVSECLADPAPEVRAAAIYALGCFVSNVSENSEHGSVVDHSVCAELCRKCSNDASPLARRELVVAVHWFILEFEKQFVTLAVDLLRKVNDKKQNDTIPEKRLSPKHQRKPSQPEQSVPLIQFDRSSGMVRSPSFGGDGPVMRKMSTPGPLSPALTPASGARMRHSQSLMWDVSERRDENEGATRRDIIDQTLALSDHMHNVSASAFATFGNAYSQVWLTLLRACCDPSPRVSDLAERVVLFILSKAKAALILHENESTFTNSPLHQISNHVRRSSGCTGLTTNHAPGPLARSASDPKPSFIVGSPGGTDELHCPAPSGIDVPDCKTSNDAYATTPPKLAHVQRRLAALNVDQKANNDDVLTPLAQLTPIGFSGHSTTFTPKRGSTTGRPESTVQVNNPYKRKSALIETDLVDQSTSKFSEPVHQLLSDDTNATKTDCPIRLTEVTEWAIESKQKLGALADRQFYQINNKTARLENQRFVAKLPGNLPATALALRPLETALCAAVGDTISMFDYTTSDKRGKFEAGVCKLWPHHHSKYISWLEMLNPWTHAYVLCGTPCGRVRVHNCGGHSKHLLADPIALYSPPLVTAFQVLGVEETSHTKPCSYAWAQDSGLLISAGGETKCIRLWDLNSELLTAEIGLPDSSTCVTADGSGSKVVAAGFNDGSVRFYDRRMPSSEGPTNTLRGLRSPVVNVGYVGSNLDTIVAAAADGQVRVWQPRNFAEPTAMFKPVSGGIINMQVHTRGLVACSSTNSGVEVTDLNGLSVGSIKYHDGMMGHKIMTPTAIRFHWEQASIAVATADRFIAVHALPNSVL